MNINNCNIFLNLSILNIILNSYIDIKYIMIASSFNNDLNQLDNERDILQKLLYRNHNQHENTKVFISFAKVCVIFSYIIIFIFNLIFLMIFLIFYSLIIN